MLWGKYLTLTNSEPFPLLTNMVVDRQGRVQFFPTLSREVWRQGEVALNTQRTAQQEHGQVGGKERARRAQARKDGAAETTGAARTGE